MSSRIWQELAALLTEIARWGMDHFHDGAPLPGLKYLPQATKRQRH